MRILCTVVLFFSHTGYRSLAEELSVSLNVADKEWLSRFERIELSLNRPVDPSAERLAIFLGNTDLTPLFTHNASSLTYSPDVFPLPAGETDLVVYIVDGNSSWNELGRFPIKVLRTGGFERVLVAPAFTLNNKGQVAEDHFPDTDNGTRKTFQELTGQLQLRTEVERSGIVFSTQSSIVGVSFQPEALRFGEKGNNAPKYDLANYLMNVQVGATGLTVGNIEHGRQRHLLTAFSSRGVTVSSAVGSFADFSGAVMNGTSIVGWDNALGLKDDRHRLYSGTLGLEVFPDDPGMARVEGSYVSGSVLPLNSFNTASITDAERSRGGAVRVILSDPARIALLEAGFARTRFTNPPDPFLIQDENVVPVEPTTRQARYADLSVSIIRDLAISESLPVNVSAGFRHERVDPLYRAVGISVRSDLLQNALEARGSLGPFNINLVHLQAEDNLDNVPSVLKTMTRQFDGGLGAGFPALLPSVAEFVPSLTYNYSRTHQFGVAVPTNSDFTETRVPDQVTTSHTASLAWQTDAVRFGYRVSSTDQDNRQAGRETADIVSRTNAVALSLTPLLAVSLSLDAAVETLENKEVSTMQRTRRFAGTIVVAPFDRATLSATASSTVTKDDAATAKQKGSLLTLEASYGFDFSPALVINWSGQLFIRYSWIEVTATNSVFDVADYSRAWSVSTGINFSIF